MMAKGFTLLDTLAEINRKLSSLLPAGIFLAAAALRINPYLKTALAWNSGMPELLLCRGDGSRRLIASHHPPLGVLPEFMPGTDVERVRLGPGDGFMLWSDGLTEACNPNGEAFGETRFVSLLEARCAIDAFDALCEGVGDFIHDADQRDDISLVAIPCVPELMADATDQTGWGTEALPPSPWQWSLRLEGAISGASIRCLRSSVICVFSGCRSGTCSNSMSLSWSCSAMRSTTACWASIRP